VTDLDDRIGHAIIPLLAVPTGRSVTELLHSAPQYAHHEAGHAVMFWRHGWHFDYVTMHPRGPMRGRAWGLVRDHSSRKIDTQPRLAAFMEIRAAGLITQWWYQPPHDMRSSEQLLTMFQRTAETPEDPNDTEDVALFVRAGQEMDRLRRAADPGTVAGAETWLPIWLNAERQIICELWPAVRAIADELRHVRRRMRYARAEELADAAMSWWSAQRSCDP
jgi:hypothetical protein